VTLPDPLSAFLSEHEVYALLRKAGITPPRHGMLGQPLPFAPNEAIVLKGQAIGLLHKSDVGAVRFLPYDLPALQRAAESMQQRSVADGLEWIGALVCERIGIARSVGLPTEALVSLSKGEGGWTLLFGVGGLQAEAVATSVPPLCWPMELVNVDTALQELREHLLGRIWLGSLRGTPPLTTDAQLRALLDGLWRLRDFADEAGLDLVELNPVALDATGEPRPLDGVGRKGTPDGKREPPPQGFLTALLAPHRVALAGVSAAEGGVGRTILDNLRRCDDLRENLLLIKPGHSTFLGLPCVPDVSTLQANPVELLILALPAAAAVDTVLRLLSQGGGARVVALVAGGIGDGADVDGLGVTLMAEVRAAREAGRWTPALVGPNFLGHWVPARDLDSSFIPVEKIAVPARAGGTVALLSQSGAYLLSRLSRNPQLPLGLALALGNQLDVALPDVLEALEAAPEFRVLGVYVEGFGPGELAATARVARRLCTSGRRVLLYRAGRTTAGQEAAASHTGAIAGNWVLEEALLRRVGCALASTQQAFDAGLAWLGAYPELRPGPVTVVTNAGFESVCAGDVLSPPFVSATLDRAAATRLQAILEREGLGGLVTARLPLDLTPMANETAFLKVVEALVEGPGTIVVLGLIPFTRRLHTDAVVARSFAHALAVLTQRQGAALGGVVDAGSDYEPYRDAFTATGVPVFTRMEEAIEGLRATATLTADHSRP
jgi:acyl-CoA synthetase (NDP forming)